jgi:polyphosphate kinase 2 (PPK2 family)
MSAKDKHRPDYPASPPKKAYKLELQDLRVELVKLQKHIIAGGDRILMLFGGRDSGGKDGTIKRIIQHLSPRETRVVALGKPSDHDRTSWYFQRYAPHLPAAEEMVLFNRSWYNRAGVERVMGFCRDAEYEAFMEMVPAFEQLLLRSGVHLVKYYLDISKDEQPLNATSDSAVRQATQATGDPCPLTGVHVYCRCGVFSQGAYTHARA